MTKYIAGLSFLFIAACGGGAPEEAPKAEEKTEKVEEKPAEDKAKSEDKAKAKAKAKKKEGPNIVTIEGDVASVALEGSDTMQFNATEIRVKKGNKVKLTLKHTGKMKKVAMGHNFVLLKAGTNMDEFAKKAAAAQANDHIPEGMQDSIVANTKLLGGGEEDTIEFPAPPPGEYDFLCSFPGHYGLMKGKFIVEE